MINYDAFKEIVVERFFDFLPKKWSDYKIELTSVKKVNESLDGMRFVPPEKDNKDGIQMFPIIYLNHIYNYYLANDDLDRTLHYFANIILMELENHSIDMDLLDFALAKDNIVMILINTKMNEELLKSSPNRTFEDLSILYRWYLDFDNNVSTTVTYEMAERLGFCEEQLYELAKENTIRLLEPQIKTIQEIEREIMNKYGMPGSHENNLNTDIPQDEIMYVITNKYKLYGAVCLLFENYFQSLAEEFDTDLYILPSAVHEVIVLPAFENLDVNKLLNMVFDMNHNHLELNEILSDNIYYYNKNTRIISLYKNS